MRQRATTTTTQFNTPLYDMDDPEDKAFLQERERKVSAQS